MKKLLDLKLSKLKQFKRVIIQKGGYFKDNSVFMMALFIYTFFAILFFNYYQYIVTIDGIFYISIAHAYALHDFSNAINGYWSPLLSWLLSPSLFFGSSNIYLLHSAKILSIIKII